MDNFLGLCGGLPTPTFDSKGSAIAFAVVMSIYHPGAKGLPRINYKKAKRLFDFICSNVQLPDTKAGDAEFVGAMVKGITDSISPHKADVM